MYGQIQSLIPLLYVYKKNFDKHYRKDKASYPGFCPITM